MRIVNISKLIDSLQQVDWNYDFEIIENEDGSANLVIPDFILRDLKWAIESGKPTPREEVCCKGFGDVDYGETEKCYYGDAQGNQIIYDL